MHQFKFDLQQQVRIICSGEVGEVIGRCEYANGAPPSYLLRYSTALAVAHEAWWSEESLEAALAKAESRCQTCNGSGRYRPIYGREVMACPDCLTSRISDASAATVAASNPDGNSA